MKPKLTLKAIIAVADPALRQAIVEALEQAGFEAAVTNNGTDALDLVQNLEPDVVVADRLLPGLGGIALCKAIRSHHMQDTPRIVILSDSSQITHRLEAIDSGADDYVAKPFSVTDLLLRISTFKRHQPTGRLTQVLKAGSIEMVPEQWVVYVNGKPIDLTEKEYRLLQELLEVKGRVLSREVLLERVWGHQKHFNLETRTVDVHMSRLRSKLGPSGANIITVRNVGYRIAVNSDWLNP